MNIWNQLYEAARKVQNERTISPFIEAGGVAAAILTKKGNIYVGVCIDTASTLGMCAERNAIANMITNGESQIDKVVAVMEDGNVGSPCGACREYMMQLEIIAIVNTMFMLIKHHQHVEQQQMHQQNGLIRKTK